MVTEYILISPWSSFDFWYKSYLYIYRQFIFFIIKMQIQQKWLNIKIELIYVFLQTLFKTNQYKDIVIILYIESSITIATDRVDQNNYAGNVYMTIVIH